MSGLSRFRELFVYWLARVIAFLRAIIGDLHYTPPRWTRTAVDRFHGTRAGIWLQSRLSWMRANPKRSWQVGGALVVATAGIWIAAVQYMKYLDSLPKPDYVEVTVQAPGEPDFETDKPKNLEVRFSSSAAHIKALGKPVSEGIRLKPEMKGTWKWASDSVLEFTPAEGPGQFAQWEIGREYTIEFSKKVFPDHVLLKELKYVFSTPQVSGDFSKQEFYQDPRDPNVKKAVFNIRYNYVLDTEDFKKRLKLTLQSKDSSVLGEAARAIPFSVTFNQAKNEAFVFSESIPLPMRDAVARLSVAEGVRAARGGRTGSSMNGDVLVPGIYERFKVDDVSVTFARNEKFEPEQILVLNTKAEIASEQIEKEIKVWLLPKRKADENPQVKISDWNSASEVTDDVRKKLEPVKLKLVPAAEENSLKHTFKVDVPVGRYLYVFLPKGVKAFGGYELFANFESVIGLPEYPKELMIMSEGSLLSFSGDKKLPLLARNLKKVRFQLYRVLPQQLNQFVYHNYRYDEQFSSPSFSQVSTDTLSEVFEKEVVLEAAKPSATQYFSLDLEPYLSKEAARKGMFFVKVRAEDSSREDSRLILVTDLGVIVKMTNDRHQEVFVQNLRTGGPVAGAEVEVIGANGLAVLEQKTNAEGRASFPPLDDFKNEKRPIAFVVKKDGDLSFLPFQLDNRRLNFSKFDIGGLRESSEGDQLSAFLFSDRGIYRPGDKVNLGMMVRARNGKSAFSGVPIMWSVTDARGTEILREKTTVSSGDLSSLEFTTQDTAATGVYSVQVFVLKKDKSDEQIGSLNVRVEEFMPDRMRISASLSKQKLLGWVPPEKMTGLVSLKNLFGTPAEERRVSGEIVLTPVNPRFKAYSDYQFTALKGDEQPFSEVLQAKVSDEKGEASFDLDLSRFSAGMYSLRFNAEGFEAAGGRAVAASAATLVSTHPYMIGVKASESLSYLKKDAQHEIDVIAVDPDLKKVAAPDIKAVLIEKRYISALMKQTDGTYKYQSVMKEITGDAKPFQITGSGTKFRLPTVTPGEFVVVFKNKADQELNRVAFSVAGSANLSRSLEKNAELQLKLDKRDFAPGAEIEMQIKAPYTGAGLITIERDRVLASKWFKTSTTSTVERIRIPDGVEGNAYVNVTFLRAPDSKEIFMSPLSYAVEPFSVSLDSRKIDIKLETPPMVRPGDVLKVSYSASRPTRMILYGVDEGILQVAKYKLPEPLNFFFQRRALQVATYQLLDLLIPEYSVLASLSAPGGDEEGALSKNLNPFKRKTEAPVAFWSGVLQAGPQAKTFAYEVPDYFNGNIKVMAVASSGGAFGSVEQATLSRGDFIISSNIPTFVTPGDEFDVGVGLSNQAEGTGANAQVNLEIKADAFEIIGAAAQTIPVPEGREKAAKFRLRAKTKLGSAPIRFAASAGGKSAKASVETSIRPAVPYMTDLVGGIASKASFDIPVARTLAAEFRKQTATLSPVPLAMGQGLLVFLDSYPYGCSEQITSKLFPYIVLKGRPEFKIEPKKATEMFNSILAVLRTRQSVSGEFAMYDPDGGEDVPVTLYVTHMLIEAKDRGFPVPAEVLSRALGYLASENLRDTSSLVGARQFAYALYLQARSGVVPGNDLGFLTKVLKTKYKNEWAQDLAAGFLAATFQIVKKEDEGREIVNALKIGETTKANYEVFYDSFVRDTALIYLISKHFPGQLKALVNDTAIRAAFAPLSSGQYNTHSASWAILALDGLFSAASKAPALAQLSIREIQAKGIEKVLALPSNTVIPSVEFSSGAEKIRYGVPTDVPYYFAQVQSGFDLDLPKTEIKRNLEVVREYLGADNAPLAKVNLGEEIRVRLRVRSTDNVARPNIAIVDLLPSGLEPILEVVDEGTGGSSEESAEPEGETDAHEGESGEYGEDAPPPDMEEGAFLRIYRHLLPEAIAQTVAKAADSVVAALTPQYVDRREDRVVIYSKVTGSVQEFVYRAKAVAPGTFVVPPAFAESMYDRTVQYRGMSSKFTVVDPTAGK